MFKVHTRTGRTIKINLDEPSGEELWKMYLEDERLQSGITGITSNQRCLVRMECPCCSTQVTKVIGTQVSASRPDADDVRFSIQTEPGSDRTKGYDKIVVVSDLGSILVTNHSSQPAVRVKPIKVKK